MLTPLFDSVVGRCRPAPSAAAPSLKHSASISQRELKIVKEQCSDSYLRPRSVIFLEGQLFLRVIFPEGSDEVLIRVLLRVLFRVLLRVLLRVLSGFY